MSDFHMTNDIDADWSTVGDQRALLEACFRRLKQTAGGLFYDQSYGTNVGDFQSAAITIDRIIALMIIECRKEDAVNDVEIDILPNGDFNVRIDSDFGEFSFMLAQQEAEADGT